jgi:excisionase family DNA binding protein
MSPEPLWTWRELGEYLGLKRSAVMALVSRSDLPCVYPGGRRRFDPVEVRTWVLKQRTPGGARLTHPDRQPRKVA